MSRTRNTVPMRLRTPEQKRKFWSRFWTQDWCESKALSGHEALSHDLKTVEGVEEAERSDMPKVAKPKRNKRK